MKFNFQKTTIGLLLFYSYAISANEIRIGAYDLPPHLYQVGNEIRGSLYSFIENEIMAPLKLSRKWSMQPFSRLMSGLQETQIDCLGFLAKTSEREKYLEFPKTPTFITHSVLIFRKGNAPSHLDGKTFSRLKIGHTFGSIVPPFLEKRNAKIHFLTGENALARNLNKLNLGRIDGVFVPTESHAEQILRSLRLESKMQVVRVPDTKIELFITVRKTLDNVIKAKILNMIDEKNSKYQVSYLGTK